MGILRRTDNLIYLIPRQVVMCLVIGALAVTSFCSASGQTEPDLGAENAAIPPGGEAGDVRIALSLADWIEKYPAVAVAKDHLVSGNIEEATKQLVTAVADNSELPQAEVILAEFYFSANDLAGAVAALDRAAKNVPADPEPYLTLGNLAFTQNRNTDARVLFEKAASLASSLDAPQEKRDRIMLRLHAGQASVAERGEHWEKAIPHLETWIKLDPKNPAAHVRLARALFRTKRGKDAYARAQKASELSKDYAKAPIFIAQFYTETGQGEMAEKWLGEAEKKYGDDLNTRLILAELQWQQGRLAHAKRHIEVAIKLDPSSPKAAMLAGMVAHLDHDYATAQQHFEAAREAAPNDIGPRDHLALVLAVQDDAEKLDQALKLAQATRKDFPNSAVAAATLGFIQLQLGQSEEAVKNFQLAGSTGRGTGNMAFFFAKHWAAVGNNEQALNVLSQVINSKQLFVFRKDAEQLYEELGKK